MSTLTFPEKFEPIADGYALLLARRIKLDVEIAANLGKASIAQSEQRELQSGDPADDNAVRRLAEATVRCQLYTNHQASLEKELGEVRAEAVRLLNALAREIRKVGLQYQGEARQQFLAAVGTLAAQDAGEVKRALQFLESPQEIAGRILDGDAQPYASPSTPQRCPFQSWEKLWEIWTAFQAKHLINQTAAGR